MLQITLWINSWSKCLKSYRWLLLLFTCQCCVPTNRLVGIANRLTHRTRLLEDNLSNTINSGQRYNSITGIVTDEQQQNHHHLHNHPNQEFSPSINDYLDQFGSSSLSSSSSSSSTPNGYRSIDKRYGYQTGLFDQLLPQSSSPRQSQSQSQSQSQEQANKHRSSSSSSFYSPSLLRSSESSVSSPLDVDRMSIASSLAPTSTACVAPDSRIGQCYDAAQCVERGGIPMGRCGGSGGGGGGGSSNNAPGGGGGAVCCMFESTCGDTIQERHSYFRNPNFPLPSDKSQICRLKVHKASSIMTTANSRAYTGDGQGSICQLKLTFNQFDIAKPIGGNCSQDVFAIYGQNENNIIPRICGYNTGQHYYIAVDESGMVNLQLVLRGLYPRRWNIHLEQIECGSPNLAPPYCLQYYDSTLGTIKSFNYDTRSSMSNELNHQDTSRSSLSSGSQSLPNSIYEGYPNNIDYLICIRKETGFCSISYEFMSDPLSGTLLPFSVGQTSTAQQSLYGGSGGGGGGSARRSGFGASSYSSSTVSWSSSSSMVQSNDCEDDYLVVGGLRVCTKTEDTNTRQRNGNGNGDNDDTEHVTVDEQQSTSSSSSSSSSVSTTTNAPTPSMDDLYVRVNESSSASTTTNTGRPLLPNGELLHETMDESISEFGNANGGGGNVGGTNGGLRINPSASGATSNIEQEHHYPLRRTHRRANLKQYYGNGGGRQAHQSSPPPLYYYHDTSSMIQSRATSNLLATDWTPGPFQLRFVANGANNAKGFYLAYRQNPCRM